MFPIVLSWISSKCLSRFPCPDCKFVREVKEISLPVQHLPLQRILFKQLQAFECSIRSTPAWGYLFTPGIDEASKVDAIWVLINSNWMSWSHWEHTFAPSLDSFFDWYVSLGCIGDGHFNWVEFSATVDQFLDAFIQLSPLLAVVNLLCFPS